MVMTMGEQSRRKTRPIQVGEICIGGDAPVSVQTMTNTDTCDVDATVVQIRSAAAAGAHLVRVAVPSIDAAAALRDIIPAVSVPIVADIHFDYRLAIAAVTAGAHKLRINPGNIGNDQRLGAVAEAAKDAGIPIRVGVNAGSLERELLERYGSPTAEALCESALRSVERMHRLGCDDLVVSIKASDVPTTVAATRRFAAQSDLPLHLGITEAGIGRSAIVHSAVGLGILLAEGIGDTIRVSVTGDIVQEVLTGRDILLSLGLISGPRLVSCPTCARCKVNLEALAEQVQELISGLEQPLLVAVMGCEVNGPGEAREADVGLAAGDGRVALFRRGEVIKTVKMECAFDALSELIAETVASDFTA
jgi:(E)-4-hydroxy-3-methylbut-2-enyl-diphosphate synthase